MTIDRPTAARLRLAACTATVLALVLWLRAGEPLCGAAPAQGHRCDSSAAEGHALSRGHRLCLGDKHHQSGRAGAGLPAEDQLQGRRPGEGGSNPLRHRARAVQAQARASARRRDRRAGDIEAGGSGIRAAADLASRQVASKQALDNATANRDSARARLKQAEVDTAQAALNLGYTEVKAPFDGIVTARLVSLGELVGAN